MSQHDLEIGNQTFPAFRSDLNNALQALGSLQSGATQPATTYANQLWYDTANNELYLRNEANDAWIQIFDVNQTSDVIELISKLKAPNGSQSTPSITFDSDLDTGIFRSGTNELAITTNGSERLIVDSSGDTTLLNGTPSLKIKDVNSTGNSQVGDIQFVNSANTTNATIGFLSSSNGDLTIQNFFSSSANIHLDIRGTAELSVTTDQVTVDHDLDVGNNLDVTGSVTATSFSGSGANLTGLPSFEVEGRADAFGNDTTIQLSANTVLVLGEVFINTSASTGARVSVELKNSGGTVIDSFDLLGMNEFNGTDGGSGMSGRVNFTIAVPATVTQIRFHRTSGSRTVDGTVNQFLKFG